MTITIPLEVMSEANRREHYMAKARRVKCQRQRTWAALAQMHGGSVRHSPPPAVVRLTRLMGHRQRPFDADDNLRAAFKAVKDEICSFFSVDDGPKCPIRWEYGQDRSPLVRAPSPQWVPGIRIELC